MTAIDSVIWSLYRAQITFRGSETVLLKLGWDERDTSGTGCGRQDTRAIMSIERWQGPGSLKVGRLHNRKNNVISGFIRNLVLNTHSSTLAPTDGGCGTLCMYVLVFVTTRRSEPPKHLIYVYSSAYRNLHDLTSISHVNNQCQKP